MKRLQTDIINDHQDTLEAAKVVPIASDGLEDADVSSDDDRIIYFAGDVTEAACSQAVAAIFSMAKKDSVRPIYLILETYGGSVDSMYTLYDAMKFVRCPIHTIGMGKIMSAGVLILAAGTKGKRVIAPHARIMTHASHGELSGNVFEIKHELAEWERQEDLRVDAMVRETGQPREVFVAMHQQPHDHYLTPQQCIDLNIVDDFLYVPTDVTPVTNNKKRIKKQR